MKPKKRSASSILAILLLCHLCLNLNTLALGNQCEVETVVDIQFEEAGNTHTVRKSIPSSARANAASLATALENTIETTIGEGTLISAKRSLNIVCGKTNLVRGGILSGSLNHGSEFRDGTDSPVYIEVTGGEQPSCQSDTLGGYTTIYCPGDQSEVILDDLGNFVVLNWEPSYESISEAVDEFTTSHMQAIQALNHHTDLLAKGLANANAQARAATSLQFEILRNHIENLPPSQAPNLADFADTLFFSPQFSAQATLFQAQQLQFERLQKWMEISNQSDVAPAQIGGFVDRFVRTEIAFNSAVAHGSESAYQQWTETVEQHLVELQNLEVTANAARTFLLAFIENFSYDGIACTQEEEDACIAGSVPKQFAKLDTPILHPLGTDLRILSNIILQNIQSGKLFDKYDKQVVIGYAELIRDYADYLIQSGDDASVERAQDLIYFAYDLLEEEAVSKPLSDVVEFVEYQEGYGHVCINDKLSKNWLVDDKELVAKTINNYQNFFNNYSDAIDIFGRIMDTDTLEGNNIFVNAAYKFLESKVLNLADSVTFGTATFLKDLIEEEKKVQEAREKLSLRDFFTEAKLDVIRLRQNISNTEDSLVSEVGLLSTSDAETQLALHLDMVRLADKTKVMVDREGNELVRDIIAIWINSSKTEFDKPAHIDVRLNSDFSLRSAKVIGPYGDRIQSGLNEIFPDGTSVFEMGVPIRLYQWRLNGMFADSLLEIAPDGTITVKQSFLQSEHLLEDFKAGKVPKKVRF